MNKIKDTLLVIALLLLFTICSFFVGRYTKVDGEGEITKDTVVIVDTVRYPRDVIQTQLVTQEVVKWKYQPLIITDTLVVNDTIIQFQDGVAVIPISLKTYTDSATYKAVISGYDPRLESIEVYQTNTVITNIVKPSRWSVGLQGGLYATPKGLQPGIGVGFQYSIPIRFKHN